MELALDDNLLRELVRTVSPGADIQARDVLSDWQLSRVERVHLEDGSSIIIKRSRSPLTAEGRVLQSLRTTDIPLADLYLADEHEDTLTLLIEDLGPSRRQPSVTEAAAAAVRAHAAPPPDGLPVMDQEALQSLPRTIAAGIESLDSSGRWRRTDRLRGLLETISGLAPELSQSASMPPFGLCHSEFHPTSLHVGEAKTALVDWARAYVGPGLLDLASWFQMGATPPDAADCRSLIDAYVAAGGAPEATAQRASLPAESWALFWNRLWGVEWYVRCCTSWMTDRTQDPMWEDAVERHLREAVGFLP